MPPQILKLPNGLLVISSGRPGLYVWVADDPPTRWTSFNLAEHHNNAFPDASFHYSNSNPGGDETTSYTGMALQGLGNNGVIVTYDYLANGWNPAPWPRKKSAIFSVRIDIEKYR